MQHTISTMTLRGKTGDILDHVRLKNDTYIVERKKKPIAVISSMEKELEYSLLIKEKVNSLEKKIKENTALTADEFKFLLKHNSATEHGKYSEEDATVYCNQDRMNVLNQFGGCFGLEELTDDKMEKWTNESQTD